MKNNLFIKFIIEEVKQSKYFSIIMNSIRDFAKIYRKAIVNRYVTSSKMHERLFDLVPVTSHKGESIYNMLYIFLENAWLDIKYCQGQSYDNPWNISGVYEDLQVHIKNQNHLATYTPCTAHSLNLVGVHSADCFKEEVSFF